MKKRITTMVIGLLAGALLVGCGNGEISNDKITITKYKGLEVEAVEEIEVTDESIQLTIDSDLQILSTETEITDRPAKEGDKVTIDYVGKMDGVEFEGGKAENQTFVLGQGQYIEGFQEKIVGRKVGEIFDVDVTFPDPYPNNPDMAGKPAVFTMTLHKIVQIDVPELTDELLPEIGTSAKTVEEYKEQIRKDQEKSNAETVRQTLEQEVWQALIENCVVEEYPEDLMKEKKTSIESQFSSVASMYGMEVDEVVKTMYGLTVEEMAKELVCQELAIELIAEEEKITVTDKVYEKKMKEYAEQFAMDDIEEFEKTVGKENIEKTILQEMIADFLIENCVQVEKKATE